MFTMRDLQNEYFKTLPLMIASQKPDTEPLMHPIFTYGDLRKVMAAADKMRELQEKQKEKP